MNASRGRGIIVSLLLVSGCGGSSAVAPGGGAGRGGSGGSAGAVGSAGGGAGGEPASAGASGGGTAGSNTGGGGAAGTSLGGTGGGGSGGSGGGAGSGGGGAGSGGGGGGTAWLTPPPVIPALTVPAGARVKLHAHAIGAQIYTCTASGGGVDAGADAGAPTYAWVLKAPDAKLYDQAGVQMGTHGAGPIWTANDGSLAHGVKVIEWQSTAADAISWLLLRVSSTTGVGAFSDVTYVQRLSTVGGKAPATGCEATTVGTDVRSNYAAEYYFFTGGGAAGWLTAPTNVPAAIAPPMGLRLKLHFHAIGMQIYHCASNVGADAGAAADTDAGAAMYAWVFKTPNALLYDMNFVPVGRHGVGPSWTSSDGSILVAKELARVASPLPDAVPWLLLEEVSTTGPGELDDIAIVQRLNTAGGQAPTTVCDATKVDTQTGVPYSADYYFFVSTAAPDGGAAD